MNKRALESLVKCGALDSTGASRMGMLGVLEQALALRAEARRGPARRPGVDLRPRLRRRRERRTRRHHPPIATGEFEKAELLRLEKETLGLYVSEHPLSAVRDQLRRKTDATLGELERRRDGEVVTVGGIVSGVKHLTTKKGEPMVFLQLEDPTGSAEVVVFDSTYQAARELCVADRILVVKGRVDHKQQGETKLIALELTAFEAVRRAARRALPARRPPGGRRRDPRARPAREGVPGRVARLPRARHVRGAEDLALGPDYRVQPDSDFLAEARSLLGSSAFSRHAAYALLASRGATAGSGAPARPCSRARGARRRGGDRPLARRPAPPRTRRRTRRARANRGATARRARAREPIP